MSAPRRHGLVWRFLVLGVAQLVLLVLTAVIGARLTAPPGLKTLRLEAEAAATRVQPLLGDPAKLQPELDALRDGSGIDVSIYDADERLVATNARPPVGAPFMHGDGGPRGPPPGPPPGPPLNGGWFDMIFRGNRGPPLDTAVPLEARGAHYQLLARSTRRVNPWPVAFTALAALLVVALAALLATRWLVNPLRQLTRAARELGAGDLRARTRLHRNDELGEVGRAFDEMAERVQRLLLAEKELMANVSHELRTPLSRIRVALDLAAEADAAAARAMLPEINLDLDELEQLLDDVLTASRFELSGREQPAGFLLRKEKIAASEIARRAKERFVARHPERPLELDVRADAQLEADPVLLRRTVENLLENAHKYSPDTQTPVLLVVSAGGFEVRDRGMGISADDLPRVFTPFFRVEKSRSRGGGGVGLGLTLARRIVEAHGGRVDIESALGVGTTVRVSLPG